MYTLNTPWVLILLPLPLLIYWLVPPYRQRSDALRLPFFRSLARATGSEIRQGATVLARPRIHMGAAIAIWCLTVLALATPVRLGDPQEITRAKRDVVLAIDISGSMDARDFPGPDKTRIQRLEAVRGVVAGFVERRQGDRMALIVFGSQAFVQAPLTEDLDTVLALLEQTEVGMAGPHTALGDALGLAIRTFEASDIDQRLLILLSDGNDTASRMSPINAADIAAQKSVEIYAIGVGDPDATGEDRLDQTVLADIAKRTGGQDFFAGDTESLEEIYTRIDDLVPRETETLSWRPRQDLSYLCLGLAVSLGLLVMAHGVFRRRITA
ncbi:Ca-activated chloride channel family protein [Shimia haliotis]|uniref:Ca-activated chloride channel family protein n=1 Tax=Shimia haliotis TaxID=1280847 RepID=A0A1I4HF77_9RHOB|nr:Ca-activated chloride channel family protein [Shimia haliotis]